MNKSDSTRPDGTIKRGGIVYTPLVHEGTSSARFVDGTVVSIRSGRGCRFPRLRASAPDTSPLYVVARAYFQNRGKATRVLDAGCGAGTGTAILGEQFDSVLGVDSDEASIAFARKFYSECTFRKQTIESHSSLGNYDLIFACDLLGQVNSPLSVLNHLRAQLADNGCIFVAEALSYPSQSLLWPTRRAFSRRALTSLLGAAGFRIEKWLVDEGTYVGCVAALGNASDCQHLAAGADAQSLGDADQALFHFQQGAKSENHEVALEATLAEAELRSLCNDGDGAASAYLRAAAMSSVDPRAKAGLSQISCGIGEYIDALSLADSALRIDTTDVSSACSRALALEHLSPTQSISAWRLALGLAPDNAQIAIRLAHVAKSKSERLLALWALTRVRKYAEPAELDFYLVLLATLRDLGRNGDADTELSLARKRFEGEPALEQL